MTLKTLNGRRLSPCIDCPRKNYAAGCNRGCPARDEYLAGNERDRLATGMDAASKELLADGTARRSGKRRPMR